MTKLKLEDVAEDKPIKLTIELPAGVHDDLAAYAAVLGKEQPNTAVTPQQLIAPMIIRFMATDRAFAKARRELAPNSDNARQ
ncbi:DUF2274 domain-containing protein [Parasphingorhabdus sp.]|uniref:DUF2274 domain-containing protein n=1 Tax=Parasphingorhabdus sp. TaxID=2709688 RepID=UPI003D267EA4